MDAVLANEPDFELTPRAIKGMRLAIPTTIAMDELDPVVAEVFERTIKLLIEKGAMIERIEVPSFNDIPLMSSKGGFTAAESYAWHRELLAAKGDVYDPRVSVRIARGETQNAADYIDLLPMRRSLIARTEAAIAPYDAVVMPTCPIAPPSIAEMDDDKVFAKKNLMALRNCTLINMIDGCAISLPISRKGEAPVGLMLAAAAGSDRRIFELAAGVEASIRG